VQQKKKKNIYEQMRKAHTRQGSFITFNQLPGNWHLEIHELPHARVPYRLAQSSWPKDWLKCHLTVGTARQWPRLLAFRCLYLYLYRQCRQRTACGANLFLLRAIRVLRLLLAAPPGRRYLPPAGCLAIDYWQTAFNYCSASGQRNSIRPPNNDAE